MTVDFLIKLKKLEKIRSKNFKKKSLGNLQKNSIRKNLDHVFCDLYLFGSSTVELVFLLSKVINRSSKEFKKQTAKKIKCEPDQSFRFFCGKKNTKNTNTYKRVFTIH